MTLDDKINALQSDFQSLADRLDKICDDVWSEKRPKDADSIKRKAKYEIELSNSVDDFKRSTKSVFSLLAARKAILIETAKHGNENDIPPEVADDVLNPTDSKRIAIEAIKSVKSNCDTDSSLANKVVMLLAVSKLIETGDINSSEVEFNNLLSDRFRSIFNEIGISASLEDACQAYFDLRFTSFWRLKAMPERESELRAATTIESLNHLNRLVIYADLDKNLFQCLRWPGHAEDLQNRIIRQYPKTISGENVTQGGVLVDATEETGQDASIGSTLRADFTDTQPSMISIEGQSYTDLSSWIDLLKAACNYCARRNPVLFESLTGHKYFSSTGRMVFARDPNTLKNPTRLDNNMWVEGLSSANGIAELLITLFGVFGIDEEDVRVTLQDSGVWRIGPIRIACVDRIAEHMNSEFVRDGATLFKTKDHRLDLRKVLLVSVSMDYGTGKQFRFKFNFSKPQIDAIKKSKNGWLALSCGSPDTILLIRYSQASDWLSQTFARRANGLCWEVKLTGPEEGFRILNLHADSERKLEEYLI